MLDPQLKRCLNQKYSGVIYLFYFCTIDDAITPFLLLGLNQLFGNPLVLSILESSSKVSTHGRIFLERLLRV